MKRSLSFLIALALAACLVPAAAQEVLPADVITGDARLAFFTEMFPLLFVRDALQGGSMTAEGSAKGYGQIMQVQTLNEGLLQLNAERVDALLAMYPTLCYIAARNPDLTVVNGAYEFSMCMLAAADNGDLIDTLNRCIEGMIADGTLAKLRATHVAGVILSGEPVAVEMPKVQGGRALRVGVSGDMPPMDYVAADGTPAGFNTAILAEIARWENLSIEMVQVDSGARFAALASGRIDLFFWQTRIQLNDDNFSGSVTEYELAENQSIQCLTTVPYFSEHAGWLLKKSYVDNIMAAKGQ